MKFSNINLPKHLSKISIFGIFFSLLISIISFFIYFTISPKLNTEKLKEAGKLSDKINRITRQISDSISFYDIENNQTIYFGDEIFTDENSSAVITLLPSHSKIRLLPKTLIKIEQQNENTKLEIKNGQIKLLLQPKDNIALTKDKSITQLKNQTTKTFDIDSYLSDGELVVSSNSDNLIVEHNKKIQKINRDESVSINYKSLTKNLLKLITPTNDQKVSSEEPLKIEWETKHPIKISIARDLSFSDTIFQFQSLTNQKTTYTNKSLPEGEYYLKIANLDESEKKIVKFKSLKKFQINLISPKNDEKIILDRSKNKIKFIWETIDNKNFKLTLNEGTSDEKIFETKNNFFEYQPINEATIKWNVRLKLNNGEFSLPTQHFSLKIEYLKKNVLITPPENNTNFYTNDGAINFEWLAFEGEEFKVEIKNISDRSLVLNEKIKTNKFSYIPKSNGHFSLNIKSLVHPEYSDINLNFNIFTRVAKTKTALKDVIYNLSQEKTLHFEYEKNPNYLGELLFEVGKDPDFDEIIEKKTMSNNKIDYVIGDYNQYCFRVTPLMKETTFVASDTQCTTINDPNRIKIDSPKDLIINRKGLWGLDPCILEAPVSDIAAEYEFNVFEDKNMKNLIYANKSKTNKIIFFNEEIGALEYRKANIHGSALYYNYRIITNNGTSSNFSTPAQIKLPKTILSTVVLIFIIIVTIYVIFMHLSEIKFIKNKINQLFGPK